MDCFRRDARIYTEKTKKTEKTEKTEKILLNGIIYQQILAQTLNITHDRLIECLTISNNNINLLRFLSAQGHDLQNRNTNYLLKKRITNNFIE